MKENDDMNSLEWKMSSVPVEYPDALAFMDRRVAEIHEGQSPECVWLLEHPALYTAGTSAKDTDLLDASGFEVFQTGRGGEYTYHGPGQRVGYVMLDLKSCARLTGGGPDIKKYVWSLEEWIIQTLAEFGVTGERRCGRVGIWVVHEDATGNKVEEKIAAIGVRVRHWITLHGIAINVDPDLSHFAGIVPCGIAERGVTSLKALGVDVSMEAVDAVLKAKFGAVFTTENKE